MSDTLPSAEFVDFPQEATEGDIANFQNEGQRQADHENFQDFMNGEQYQEGGRHDLNPRGLSTDDVHRRTELLNHPQVIMPEEQTFVQGAPQPQQEPQDFQRLYGQSENEKGELRKELAARMDELTAIKLETAAGSVQLPQFFNALPQQAQQPQPQAQPQFNPSQSPRIVQKADGEPMFAEDVEEVLRTNVAPAIFQMQQQVQFSQAQVAEANKRLFEVEKSRLNISAQEERMFVAQNPWLQNVQDPNAYLQALGSLKQRSVAEAKAQAAQQPAPATPTPVQTPQQQQMVRQRTFVETSNQSAGPVQSDSVNTNPQRQFAQAWAESLTLPFGPERATAQRKLMKQIGARQVSGYRDPQVLTR